MLKKVMIVLILGISAPVWAGSGYWTPAGPEGGAINQVVADPVAANTYYAVGNATVYYSADGAVTWNERAAGLSGNLAPYSLSIRPGVAGHLLLGADNHLFVTTDGGLSWQDSTLALPTTERVTDTAISAGKTDRWLVGVYGNKVYMTDDGGLTWTLRGSGFFGDEIASVRIDPADSNHFWLVSSTIATAEARLYESMDAGLSWTDVTARLPFMPQVGFAGSIYMHDLRIGNSGRMYLTSQCDTAPNVTQYCLYLSTDGGANWSATIVPMMPGQLIINPANDMELYLGGDGLAYSNDGGASFTELLGDFPASATEVAWAKSGVFDPNDTSRVLIGSAYNGFYTRRGTAMPFSRTGSGYWSQEIRALTVHPGDTNRVFAGVGGLATGPVQPLFMSTDAGMSWPQLGSATLSASSIRAIRIDPLTQATPANSTVYVAGRNFGGNRLIAGGFATSDGGVYKSTDGGATWTTIDNGLPTSLGGLGTIRDMELVPGSDGGTGTLQKLFIVGSGRYYSDGTTMTKYAGRVYRSDDAGANWVVSDSGISEAFYTGSYTGWLSAIQVEVDPVTPTTLYVSTFITADPADIPAGFGNGVWKSVDGGVSWSMSSTGLPPYQSGLSTPASVLSLALDSNVPTTLYASANDINTGISSLYKSVDGAATWLPVGAGLPPRDIRDILIDSDSHVYVAMGSVDGNPGGVFVSQDGGASWHSISVGLEHTGYALKLAIDESGTYKRLYAGTEKSVQIIDLVPDSDWDGVPDSVESAGFAALDANGDGMADTQQPAVATVNAASLQRGSANPLTVSIEALSGNCPGLENVRALDLLSVPLLDGVDFSLGGLAFEIADCQQARVTLTYHNAAGFGPGWQLHAYIPETRGGDFYLWQAEDTAALSGNQASFVLTDGQGSEIGTADGRLVFQGAMGYQEVVFSGTFER